MKKKEKNTQKNNKESFQSVIIYTGGNISRERERGT